MDLQNEKCVMVIDGNLPQGIIANTAAIMGITLGKKMPEVVGADVQNKSKQANRQYAVIKVMVFPVPRRERSGALYFHIIPKIDCFVQCAPSAQNCAAFSFINITNAILP